MTIETIVLLKEADEKMEEEATAASTSKSGKKPISKPVDLDPNGEKLLQVSLTSLLPSAMEVSVVCYPDFVVPNSSSVDIQIFRWKIHWQKQRNI